MKCFQFPKYFILSPICLAPTGRSAITEPTFWWHRVITASLRGLVGERISQVQGFGLTRRERLHYYSLKSAAEAPNAVSILMSDCWNKQILRSGWKSFQLISGLAALSVFILGKAVLFLPLVAWAWLGYELTKVEIGEREFSQDTRFESFGYIIGKLMLVACAGCAFCSLFSVLCYFVTFGLAGWMLPFLLTGLMGAYAVMVRLLRLSSEEAALTEPEPITCKICRFPLKKLTHCQLVQHITPAQHTEIELNTKFYEGWQCQHCLPPNHPKDLSIHLCSYVLNNKGYQNCDTCQTLTVKVTDYPLQKATKHKTGLKTQRKCCHYCKAASTQEVVIPPLSRTLAHHRRTSPTVGYSGGYEHGSSYGSGSGSSSFEGGGFSGGESGGGGGGDSW
ncbi:MAG: hypothetical protein AAFV90_19085 [Cyanobacteria bacterium J06634_5]